MPAFKFNDPQEAYKAAALKLETLDRGLISLDLSFFGLRELPPSIGRMTSLRHLDLSSNQLGALPPEIGQLVSLKTLNLSQNRLTRWPHPLELLIATEINVSGNAVVPPDVGAAFRSLITTSSVLEVVKHGIITGSGPFDDPAGLHRTQIENVSAKSFSEAGSLASQRPIIPTEPERDAESISTPDGLVIHLRDVHQSLQQEPVLDGFDHPGLTILIDAFGNYPDAAARWMKDQLANPARASVAADILRLLCRFKPGTPVWRSEIVATALQSNADELRDAAIQAVESWAEPELVMLLEGHADAAPWLADYAAQVLEDLAEAP